MNPTAILGLLASLYEQIVLLQQENEALRRAAQTTAEPVTEPAAGGDQR